MTAEVADAVARRSRLVRAATSRRCRDLIFAVLVVAAFVAARADLPLFERVALERSGGQTAHLGVAVSAAWITAAVLLLMSMLLSAVFSGAAIALVHRISARAPRQEAQRLGFAVSALVAAYFSLRLATVAWREPVVGSERMLAFSALDVDLGLLALVALVAVVTRWVAALSWRRAGLLALLAAVVIAIFVNWSSVRG